MSRSEAASGSDDRTYIIKKRGTELDGAIQSTTGREALGHFGNSIAMNRPRMSGDIPRRFIQILRTPVNSDAPLHIRSRGRTRNG